MKALYAWGKGGLVVTKTPPDIHRTALSAYTGCLVMPHESKEL